ncbi:hypothetical protein LTR17_026893 [Elasticomyces elasticus]|nr:hypothetical protein LTR17_026893 [Elasticomyces elasticus]
MAWRGGGRVKQSEVSELGKRRWDKPLWRGTVAPGNSDAPLTRQVLVKAAEDKRWSDVEAGDFVEQVEHCRWQYLIRTEGFA